MRYARIATLMKDIVKKIENDRKIVGISKSKLCRGAKIRIRSYYNWLKGDGEPKYDDVIRIYGVLGYRVMFLREDKIEVFKELFN